MLRPVLPCLLGFLACTVALAAEPPAAPPAAKVGVVVIPVRDEIDAPVLYIVRRGLKEAIAQHADVVVLDLKTPGGALDVTFDIMEALAKFRGKTIAFVDSEAMSAGAFISATTDEIWFVPDGVIGAAAPVTSTGQDVDATMKMKVVSYLKARMRALSEGKGYRGEVISAMIDSDYELKIGDKVLKGKGELLSLTATEASRTYGSPPQPLLAAGVAPDIDALLTKKYGANGYVVKTLGITWSEELAVLLNRMAPVLLGLGLLAVFFEFKMPSHGLFGAIGVALLLVVFLGSYVAGLSGHEPVLVFACGLLLLAAEIFFVPGSVLLGLAGLVLMLGSLVWSMADLWPGEPIALAWTGDAFVRPLVNLGFGLLIAAALAVGLWRFLPEGWFIDRLVVGSADSGAAQIAGGAPEAAGQLAALVGRRGVAATALRPGGQVEVDGRRFEAKVAIGAVDAGAPVIVRGFTDFALIVEELKA